MIALHSAIIYHRTRFTGAYFVGRALAKEGKPALKVLGFRGGVFLLWCGLVLYQQLLVEGYFWMYAGGKLCARIYALCSASYIQQTTSRINGRHRFAERADSEITKKTNNVHALTSIY